MTQLWRQIGPETDVPAGDIGVGAREINFLFGQYKRLAGHWAGALTGKASTLGGIVLRTQATGYGLALFARAMLRDARGESLEDRSAAISGAGNVALHAAEKLLDWGVKVVTLSDSGGTLHVPGGMSREQLDAVREQKLERRGGLADLQLDGAEFLEGTRPWGVGADLAFPCATQNELDGDGAAALVEGGAVLVAEGANMPCTPEAVRAFREAGVLFGPGKAANAGGVAVSGLEMAQNAGKSRWKRDRVAGELEAIMEHIHDSCAEEGRGPRDEVTDYARGANIAGFRRIADAMVAAGVV
jgi:glutamate dehydrogenase (NADP+)